MRVDRIQLVFVSLTLVSALHCSSASTSNAQPPSAPKVSSGYVETRLGRTLHLVRPKDAPKVLSRVNPLYPEEARTAGTSGLVKLEALIDTSGNVVDTTILEGLPNGLAEAAATAVRQWKYEPVMIDGKPTPALVQVYINFKPN